MEHNNNQNRDQQILNRLARIEHKVDSIDQTAAFALRADADRHFASVREIFGRSERRAQVYLAINGIRGVQEIAEYLSMKRQNVGTELKLLAEEGLVEIIDTQGGRDIYSKKPLEKTLRVSKFLQGEFNLGPNGLPLTGTSNNKKRAAKKSGGK